MTFLSFEPHWPPHAKSWLIGKDSDAGRDWGQEEKGMTEDEMAGWHHGLDGRESEWTPGDGDGQGVLACCDSWGGKESDTTERLNWTELNCDITNSFWQVFIFLYMESYYMYSFVFGLFEILKLWDLPILLCITIVLFLLLYEYVTFYLPCECERTSRWFPIFYFYE